jgi:ATP-dependent Lon protease
MNDHNNAIIKIQRRYRFIKDKMFYLSKKVIFMKDCLISMSNNLTNLNKMKLYDNVLLYGYNNIFTELNLIKNRLMIIPDVITFKYLIFFSINKIALELYEINQMILMYLNHISVGDMSYLLKLLLGSSEEKSIDFSSEVVSIFSKEKINGSYSVIFTKEENDKLELLSRLFIPINVWDSEYHFVPINYMESTETPRSPISKETIDSIIESKDNRLSSVVIGNVNSFPNFLKGLTEIIIKEKKSIKVERKKDYNYFDLINLFEDNNIVLTRNTNTVSFVEEKQGFNIMIRINQRIIVINGIVKDDALELYKTNNIIASKLEEITHYINCEVTNVPNIFKTNYFNILNIRDILICKNIDIANSIKKRYNDYKQLRMKTLGELINIFLLGSKFRKYEILVLFLIGNANDCKLGYLLYDILKIKDKSDIVSDIYNSLHCLLKVKLDNTEKLFKEEDTMFLKSSTDDISYERRINIMDVSDSLKMKAIEKLKAFKNNMQGDNKAQTWLDGFLKIPFGIYRENKIMNVKKNYIDKIKEKYNIEVYSFNEINNILNNMCHIDDTIYTEWLQYRIDRVNYLNTVKCTLNKAVYGHKEAKLQLERLVGQWINGETKGAVIGLCGPPGTGKTSLAMNGLSRCLIDDDNKPRPFGFLPIGGSVNGSTLVGHNYTYVGSTWGRIVDILIESNCMNPIIFIDEIDKVSTTEYGKEIISILTHLTDSTQNDSFEDKYFSGIPLDLSKALIVFSFNDISVIDPILKDRITIVETKAYTLDEKMHILLEYMIPTILKEVGFSKNEIIFSESIIKYLINQYTNEAGVRKIKEKLVDIVRSINLDNISNNISIPFIVTEEYINILFRNKPKMRITKIHSKPEIGLVNGLYATNSGVGGLTVIQVMKYPSNTMMERTITGQQGDVMKESVEYAMKIAYTLLSEEAKNKILHDSKNKNNFGLLIHAPDAGTKKDGPSAGVAMTLAIYSVLSNKPINNTIALTGEIDLCKNVKAIGGVYAKLLGAKNAGIRLVLIPKENFDDLEILRQDGTSPEDDTFKVEMVDTIYDVIKHCIIWCD